jgi:hypothetical protein
VLVNAIGDQLAMISRLEALSRRAGVNVNHKYLPGSPRFDLLRGLTTIA